MSLNCPFSLSALVVRFFVIAAGILRTQGQEVRLGPKAYELLDRLIRSHPRAIARSQIRRRLWPDVSVGAGTLGVLMTELRAALGDDAREPRFIRTVFGYGYAFAGEIASEDAAAPSSGAEHHAWNEGQNGPAVYV
jgi:DNA-binding winged helix-turn-helix (wHTH) protein